MAAEPSLKNPLLQIIRSNSFGTDDINQREVNKKYASVALVFRLKFQGKETSSNYCFEHLEDLKEFLEDQPTVQSEVLFIKRATNHRDRWSGHVALPGGRSEKGETPVVTAIRECKEEVGIDLNQKDFMCVGSLTPRPVASLFSLTNKNKSYLLHPFIFIQTNYKKSFKLTVDPSEVAHAWWVNSTDIFSCKRCYGFLNFELSKYIPSISRNKFLKALVFLLSAKEVKFPCVYLPPPHLAPISGIQKKDGSLHKSNDTNPRFEKEYATWGLTLRVLYDTAQLSNIPFIHISKLGFSISFLVDFILLIILQVSSCIGFLSHSTQGNIQKQEKAL
mmetsp:Transcript_30141/g.39701  ORF Transcript_30141/g.39701 Transcript_30141/m.39701 type:complete len:333 (-) Transcript_30141:485-1483(-)